MDTDNVYTVLLWWSMALAAGFAVLYVSAVFWSIFQDKKKSSQLSLKQKRSSKKNERSQNFSFRGSRVTTIKSRLPTIRL